MLISNVPLVNRNIPLAENFLRAYFEPPWTLIAGGRSREFALRALPKLMEWVKQQQDLRRNVLVPLPHAGGNVWHLALKAPLGIRPAEFRLPASIEIEADEYCLLWRSQNPIPLGTARMLSEKMAREIGGGAREALAESFPLPGTIYHRLVARLERRFPVRMMPTRATAYRLSGDALVDSAAQPVASPFLQAAMVEEQPMAWVWKHVVPIGNFAIIMGEPGIGKSGISIDIAARVTSGAAFPGCKEVRKQASVIVMETEDDVASVVIPRLKAAGADMRKVLVRGDAIDLSQSVDVLENEAKRLGDLRLVVLSPVRMFFGDSESSRQVDTRARLVPLLQWAAARNVAILGVAHKEAGKKGKSGEDMAGPKAFAQRARPLLSAVIDEDDPEPEIKKKRRLLITAKANNSPDTLRLAYRIKANGDSSRIVWE